jgi:hypothetical protein
MRNGDSQKFMRQDLNETERQYLRYHICYSNLIVYLALSKYKLRSIY